MSKTQRDAGGYMGSPIRFELDRVTVIATNDCPCKNCQHSTGSGFGPIFMVPDAALSVQSGETTEYLSKVESGGDERRSFCAGWGSSL